MPAVVNDISEDTVLMSRRDLDAASTPSAPPPGPSLGELLRNRREARGLTPHQAAGQLRLLPRWIEAFENNQFDALGAPVYARGYLRKYATLLDLPPDEILARYDQLIDIPAPPPLAPIKSTGSEPVTTSRAPAVIGGVALVSVAAALIIGITQMDQPVKTKGGHAQATAAANHQPAGSAEPVKVATTAESNPATGAEMESSATPTALQSATAETVPDAKPEMTASAETLPTSETPAAATEPAALQKVSNETSEDTESAAAAAAAEDPEQPLARIAVPQSGRNLKIKLSFKGKSWTTVYAADGTRLLYELSQRGRPRTVSSPPPLTVVFGAIDAVEMRVNDKTVPIPRQPGKDSIKFVLDVEGSSQAGTRRADTGG